MRISCHILPPEYLKISFTTYRMFNLHNYYFKQASIFNIHPLQSASIIEN